jgi:ribose transport system substrate-binding protein
VKVQILAATTAIAIAISAGSAFAAEKKQLYFVPNGAVDFWKLAEAGMKKAQAELPNYSIQIKYPEQSSAAIQNRLMDDLVAGGAAGIMVSAIDPKTQTDALDKVASQSVLATRQRRARQQKSLLSGLQQCRSRQAGR